MTDLNTKAETIVRACADGCLQVRHRDTPVWDKCSALDLLTYELGAGSGAEFKIEKHIGGLEKQNNELPVCPKSIAIVTDFSVERNDEQGRYDIFLDTTQKEAHVKIVKKEGQSAYMGYELYKLVLTAIEAQVCVLIHPMHIRKIVGTLDTVIGADEMIIRR